MSTQRLSEAPSHPCPYCATARWLALGIALLIAWGSLYPLDFFSPTRAQFAARLAHAGSHFLSRTDLIANLLLYVPLGAACALAIGGAGAARRIALAGLLGSSLSLSVELMQLATPHRVTSVFDWSFNTAGAVIGAAVVVLYSLIGVRWRLASLLQPRPAVIPLCLLALWFIGEFAPYPPPHNLPPFNMLWRHWHVLPAAHWLVPFATWWLIAECLRHIVRGPRDLLCYGALIAASALERLLLPTHSTIVEDIAGCLAAVAAALAARPWSNRRRALVTAAGCLAAAAAGIAAGYRFNLPPGPPGEFHWIPFSGILLTSRDYRPLFTTWLLDGALLWSLTIVLRRLSWAFMLTFGLSVAGEVANLWTPPRRAEITGPLMIIVFYAAFAVAGRFQSYAFGAEISSAPSMSSAHKS